jgi:hypothetical protein
MIEVIEQSILGLDVKYPEELYISKHSLSDKFGCLMKDLPKGSDNIITGLACFESKKNAVKFSESYKEPMNIIKVSFEEARQIAKARPVWVSCIFIFNNGTENDPLIHYVK